MAKAKASIGAPTQAHAIAEAVRNLQLAGTQAWDELDALSFNTHVEAVEVFEDEIRVNGTRFEGPINVHVTLRYPENVTLSETFPGCFEARWQDNAPSIDRVFVDTSSFTR
ncbi:hypothetical protein [Bradyrhizobium sp. CB3481]|uniref:pPIWI-associating nuclease domain-containing protein n=1 Tax=Bradyrhizobium sp. CB3481 TaxID=3039158 RepID=UPI0024B1DDA8|nr:hypothetical protein [Bradyrhizobium sp. CB3481]WFU18545.1 hypothetical protein QA643_09470 [Bradyrhizobium sp. CB3481]